RSCSELPNIRNNSSANNQLSNNSNNGINNGNNPNGTTPQKTLQALLALINNSGISNNSENQTSYLSIPEEDGPLFLPTKRSIRPRSIVNTLILQKRQAKTKIVNLIDLEETGGNKDPDVEMEEVNEAQENQELPDPIAQNQEKVDLVESCDASKVESPKVNKKEDVKVV
ncbi:16909_t:CDS:1, partial [Racocetra persica]